MPHVSKQAIKEEIFLKISTLLLKTLSKRGFAKDRKYYLKELLTRTEQIMLAKRVAIIFFLCHGDSTHQIRHRLKVSPSTVAIIKRKVDSGEYAKLTELFKNDATPFLEILEKILSAGLPPIVGKGRHRYLNDFK